MELDTLESMSRYLTQAPPQSLPPQIVHLNTPVFLLIQAEEDVLLAYTAKERAEEASLVRSEEEYTRWKSGSLNTKVPETDPNLNPNPNPNPNPDSKFRFKELLGCDERAKELDASLEPSILMKAQARLKETLTLNLTLTLARKRPSP